MNVLSLFDGMSCGQLALNKANIKYDKYYASEIDKYAIDIARKNYPNTIHLGDIQNVKGEDFIDNIGSQTSFSKISDNNIFLSFGNVMFGMFVQYNLFLFCAESNEEHIFSGSTPNKLPNCISG